MSIQDNINALSTFVPETLGKFVADPNGFYRGHCVSLVKQWLKINKWPMLYGNAIKWQYRGDGKKYRYYKNTPSFVPNPGDMAIFDIGKYGHIGIVISATKKDMKVLNQNWPHGRLVDPVVITTFDYLKPKCIGFLRKL